MDTIEIQAEAIANSLISNPAKGVTAGQAMVDGDDSQSDTFYKYAGCIVEPLINDDEARDAYYEFMDNDPENWVGFIKNNFGDEWGEIAQIVTEYGY